MHCLEVVNLTKTFSGDLFKKKRTVLQELSFSVKTGVTTGFIGVNGSGKTTTLKCALGFIFQDSGEVRFFNEKLSAKTKSRIGYLPERPYLYEFLTAIEFLRYHWQLSGAGPGFEEAAKVVLEKVNLSYARDRVLRSFSKGMLQRIGMAQALLRRPDFLILDEPMSGLDPDGRLLIKEIMKEEQKRGTSIFFSSHLLNDMEELCQDVVVIDQGKLLYEGTLLDLTKNAQPEYRLVYRDMRNQQLVENVVKEKDLQNKIQQILSDKNEILKVVPTNYSIEKAFSHLRVKSGVSTDEVESKT